MIKVISFNNFILLTLNNVFAAEAGMPQLDPEYWISQVFWFTNNFFNNLFFNSKNFIPKDKGNIDARESQNKKRH